MKLTTATILGLLAVSFTCLPQPATAQLIPGYCSTNIVTDVWLTDPHGNLEVFAGLTQGECCGLCSQWSACVAYLWAKEGDQPSTCVFRDETGVKDSLGYPKPGGVLGWIEGRW